MNQLRRLVLPAMVAGLALMAWSSSASAGEYVGKFRPGNHQNNSLHAEHAAVPTRAIASGVSSIAAMSHAPAASAATASHASHASHAATHMGASPQRRILPH